MLMRLILAMIQVICLMAAQSTDYSNQSRLIRCLLWRRLSGEWGGKDSGVRVWCHVSSVWKGVGSGELYAQKWKKFSPEVSFSSLLFRRKVCDELFPLTAMHTHWNKCSSLWTVMNIQFTLPQRMINSGECQWEMHFYFCLKKVEIAP